MFSLLMGMIPSLLRHTATETVSSSTRLAYHYHLVEMLLKCLLTWQARKGPKPIKTEIQTESWMRCDERDFLLENKLTTRLDDELFWQKTWNDKVERK